jgi:hypothetical protein
MYPNDARAKHIIIIFWIVFGITILDVVMRVSLFNFYTNWENGTIPSEQEKSIAVLQMAGMWVLDIGMLVLCCVFFIRWFRRAYANLGRIGVRTIYEEGWAAGFWFVPFINLVRPHEIMTEIWNKTQLQLNKSTIVSSSIVNWWWGLYITKNVVGTIAGRLASISEKLNSNLISGLINENLGQGITSIITLPAIYVTIQMIQQMSKFEEELAIQQQQQEYLNNNI